MVSIIKNNQLNIEEVFDSIDKDHSEHINFEEFKNIIQKID